MLRSSYLFPSTYVLIKALKNQQHLVRYLSHKGQALTLGLIQGIACFDEQVDSLAFRQVRGSS